ncbi:addiction module protein [Microlunatus speluncae]|uniref:addiction module protein n=1 Tax=Microlunatus speluncae TaxID=2594267 RepID=UPI00126651ED|nr:addiction module protein [Microlunatus speluncae]
MSLSAAEFYEAGMALPPSVRKDVALQLLESVEVVDQETLDDDWTDEIITRMEDIRSGKVQPVPGDQVFAELAGRRDARNG